MLHTWTKKLYGYAISESPSTGGYKWLDPAKPNLDKYDDVSLRGYVLEFGLKCPKWLYEFHNDYPLASDKLKK